MITTDVIRSQAVEDPSGYLQIVMSHSNKQNVSVDMVWKDFM